MVSSIRRRLQVGMWVMFSLIVAASAARADSSAERSLADLAAARARFADALRDEQAGRFSDALTKFEEVRRVRDTPAIEYRIGTCHEGLNQIAAAYNAYQTATRLGQGDSQTVDVVQASLSRLTVLGKHVARLALTWPADAPSEAEARVDGAAFDAGARHGPIALEPGHHLVTTMANGLRPAHIDVVLAEGAEVSLVLPLSPANGVVSGSWRQPSDAIAAQPTPSGDRSVVGWIAVAGGIGLLGSSGVLAVLRTTDIASLNRACPGGHCPPGADRADLDATRARALSEGPLAAVLAGAGSIATGAGLYLVLTPRIVRTALTCPPARVQPFVGYASGGVMVEGQFF